MNSPTFKSEKKAAKGAKKPKLTPKTQGGWGRVAISGQHEGSSRA